jgi:hypothetical protein
VARSTASLAAVSDAHPRTDRSESVADTTAPVERAGDPDPSVRGAAGPDAGAGWRTGTRPPGRLEQPVVDVLDTVAR